MLKVGDRIKIVDRFSVFYGETLTVKREAGKGRYICVTPNRPRGEYIAYVTSDRENSKRWEYVSEVQDNDKRG